MQGSGLRWSRLGRYVLLAVPVWAIAATVLIIVSPGAMGNLSSGVQWNQHVAVMLIAVIVLVPFQAAAEEVVFRGLAMNVIGSWLKHPAWAVLIPVPFFVYGHLYDLPGLVDVGIFAVIVGILTLYTNGLEVGIAFHIVNNMFALGLGVLAGADMNETSAPTIETVTSIGAPIVFAGLVVLDTRRRQRRDGLSGDRCNGLSDDFSGDHRHDRFDDLRGVAEVGPGHDVAAAASARSNRKANRL